MNPTELTRRLRQARELAGFSQQQAADALSAPRTAVTQIEGGNRAVSTLELTKLAALYGRPVTWFFSEADEDEDVLVALHRAAPGIAQSPEIRCEVDRCVALYREGAVLERLLSRESLSGLPTYPERVPRSQGEAIAQGQRVAEEERRRLGLGAAPIADMAELIAGQGVWASGADLPDGMSGLFLCHPEIGLAILVNAAHVRARKRFSYAHEYAHALLDRDRTVTVSSADNAGELVEKRANAFAAAFLMPAEGIALILKSLDKGQPSRIEQTVFDAATGGCIESQLRQAPRSQQITYQDAATIAHHFGVSYQAAVYRLRSLRTLSHPECEELLGLEQTGRSYLRFLDMLDDLEGREPKPARELRSQIVQLAIEAYRREEISQGRLLELSRALDLSGETMLDLADAARSE